MSKRDDLTGKKFGRLTCLYPGPSKKYGNQSKSTWVCQCDCGNIKIVATNNLKLGDTTSCGCVRKGIRKIDMSGKIINNFQVLSETKYTKDDSSKHLIWKCKCLKCGREWWIEGVKLRNGQIPQCSCKGIVGHKFNHLTPVSYVGSSAYGSLWNCNCDCGETRICSTNDLTTGKVKFCSLSNHKISYKEGKDITGQKFGLLTAIEKISDEESGRLRKGPYWKCICDCGNIKICHQYDLASGRIKSCGCLKSQGEMQLKNILEQLGVSFIREYSFYDLLSSKKNPLRFDFAIFKKDKLSCLIEYDGEQHYKKPSGSWISESKFRQLIENDKKKEEYCKRNNIILIRIRGSQVKDLESYLREILKKYEIIA